MNKNYWLVGHRVELPEMLYGREKRAARQAQIHREYPGTLVCFTLNIAGPIKVFPLSMIIFRKTTCEIRQSLEAASLNVVFHETDTCSYGWEAYYAVDADPMEVKRVLLELEERRPAGRLFDIDVLRPDGSKVSREDFGLPPRSCLICGEPTIACARSRAHTVAQLQEKTLEIFLEDIQEDRCAEDPSIIGMLSRISMEMEVYTTPKPGLVDCSNTGSHTDMDVEMFEKSAAVLESYFAECARKGRQMRESGGSSDRILAEIRPLGIEAEARMLAATGGVNTHKGMIFSLGILAAATAYAGRGDVEEILETAGMIASEAWEKDFADLEQKRELTAGEQQYRAYGIGGIRAEAAGGFPSVKNISLAVYGQMLKDGCGWQEAGVWSLMSLIHQVVDTNMIKRSGREKAEELRRRAGEILDSKTRSMTDVQLLDQEFIACNASPGGCADLLALTYYLGFLRDL